MTCLKNVLPIFLKRLLNWIKLQLITLTDILVRPSKQTIIFFNGTKINFNTKTITSVSKLFDNRNRAVFGLQSYFILLSVR
jgi:hypothetical protein